MAHEVKTMQDVLEVLQRGDAASKWRKRPVVVRAVQTDTDLAVVTKEGTMLGKPGDWIIEGVEGEIYPCDDGIFRKTYESVKGEAD